MTLRLLHPMWKAQMVGPKIVYKLLIHTHLKSDKIDKDYECLLEIFLLQSNKKTINSSEVPFAKLI